MTAELIPVGIGKLIISDHPEAVLVAHGLGSCIAVTASLPPLGGMLHAMLPNSQGAEANDLTRFADSGIEALMREFEARGCQMRRAEVKLAGGASVLQPAGSTAFQVGARNVTAALAALEQLRIPIAARDLGGTKGRTVHLTVATGQVQVRRLGEEAQEL